MEKKYQELFNKMIRDVSEMIEIAGNEALKRYVKKRLFEFSDEVRECFLKEKERNKEKENIYI